MSAGEASSFTCTCAACGRQWRRSAHLSSMPVDCLRDADGVHAAEVRPGETR
ncbi:MAG: hypothetical protein JZU45_01105 [Methyloversatilis discipulorum]|nr:hypothetical protein [Methyloversatilis discipulorum]